MWPFKSKEQKNSNTADSIDTSEKIYYAYIQIHFKYKDHIETFRQKIIERNSIVDSHIELLTWFADRKAPYFVFRYMYGQITFHRDDIFCIKAFSTEELNEN